MDKRASLCKEHNQIYVPIGFAHGFLTLTDTVHFLYKCSDYYEPEDEHGIAWNDPELKICWGVSVPIVSEKDAKYPTLAQVRTEHLPGHPGKMKPGNLADRKNGQVGAELLRSCLNGRSGCARHDQLDLSNPSDIRRTIREVRPQLSLMPPHIRRSIKRKQMRRWR